MSCSESFRSVSGSRISAAIPGASLPTDPERLDDCTCSPGFFGFGLRQIDADHRRCLSESVAFENFFVEAFLEMAGKIERQFFGAGDDEPQTAELRRLGFAQVHAQERGRRQQERQLVSFDQRRALCGFQRIWIRDDAHALDERIPKCDRRAEAVKERQRRKDSVGFSCVEQLRGTARRFQQRCGG